jgi:hypothetical protein
LDKPQTSPNAWQTFLSAFGEAPEAVAKEIHEYWQSDTGSPFPKDVYNHLVDLRVPKKLSRERGEFLKAYFAESFAPEQVTGYADKHREPLVTAMVEAYSQAVPARPIYRVEADIMNLSGLNNAIEAATGSKDKDLADACLRVMTGILQRHLEPCGAILPIRRGGDELSIYVRANTTVTLESISYALEDAQREMAEFIKKAGLRDVPHSKKGRPPGVGMGCAVANIKDSSGNVKTDVQLSDVLEADILKAKNKFQERLGYAKQVSVSDALGTIEAAFNDVLYSTFRMAPKHELSILARDKNFYGENPDDATKRRLIRRLSHMSSKLLSADEHRLAVATEQLSRPMDFVTGLPLFSTMRPTIMPQFRQAFSREAVMVHIDYNNLGGGNKLGSWVGDAMSRVFADCIIDALKDVKLKTFRPYVTTQGGGKFTLLLPKALSEKIPELKKCVQKNLEAMSEIPLPLNPEQLRKSQGILAAMAVEDFSGRQNTSSADGSFRRIWVNPASICIKDISNLKNRSSGSHVVMSRTPVTIDGANVKPLIDGLEVRARMSQDAHSRLEELSYTMNGRYPVQEKPKALKTEQGTIIGPMAALELERRATVATIPQTTR